MKTKHFCSFLIMVGMPAWLNAQTGGNVGIGTLTPNARLQINHKSATFSPSLLILDSAGGDGATIALRRLGNPEHFNIALDNEGLKIFSFSKTTPQFLIANTGHVGFGSDNFLPGRVNIEHRSSFSSPLMQLLDSSDGTGNMLAFRKQGLNRGFSISTDFSEQNSTIDFYSNLNGQTGSFLHYNAVNDRMGIGTTNPQSTLDVNGSLRITGAFIADNSAGLPGQVLTSQGPNEPLSWKDIENDDPMLSYCLSAEMVPFGEDGKILGIGCDERFDFANKYDPQTATYTCPEGVFYFNARISSVVDPIDSYPHNLTLIIEVVDADNTTIKESHESVLIVPNFVKNNSKLTHSINTIIQVQENDKVRVRVKHDRFMNIGLNMNIKLEEFSGYRLY